jgi:hypothetical protein
VQHSCKQITGNKRNKRKVARVTVAALPIGVFHVKQSPWGTVQSRHAKPRAFAENKTKTTQNRSLTDG